MTACILDDKMSKQQLLDFLENDNEQDFQALLDEAYQTKLQFIGKKVHLRGLIEISNNCIKNCYYCGIRRDNQRVNRYEMEISEILENAKWAYENHYGSVVLQSGERTDSSFIERITRIIHEIKKLSHNQLGITLSFGEQDEQAYQQWFDAGAHRYLLRIEASNQALYQQIHPQDHDYSQRLACLYSLKKIGYQLGTGVMIGLPGQTKAHLAEDLLFLKEIDIDMLGMGPYLIHEDTPLYQTFTDHHPEKNFRDTLKMIALSRILMPKINIAASTAMQAIIKNGREQALLAGANIIMPNVTDVKYRKYYRLYKDKPCTDENASECKYCLENRVKSIHEEIIYDEWGDSLHFIQKNNSPDNPSEKR
jgi:biotin synthase